MSKNKKIVWAIAIIIIIITAILASFFIYNALFWMSTPPSNKQPFFVNCTYYIYPNGTYVVVNVTKVIQLGKVKPYLHDPKSPDYDYFGILQGYKWKFRDNDKNGLLSVGDQFFCKINDNKNFKISLFYHGPDADGTGWVYGKVLWDSEHGPYVWKEEE